jgi:hypothetical protein
MLLLHKLVPAAYCCRSCPLLPADCFYRLLPATPPCLPPPFPLSLSPLPPAPACLQRCPVMSAGPQYEYLWADGLKVKTPVKLSAPDYINSLFDWVEDQVGHLCGLLVSAGASWLPCPWCLLGQQRQQRRRRLPASLPTCPCLLPQYRTPSLNVPPVLPPAPLSPAGQPGHFPPALRRLLSPHL